MLAACGIPKPDGFILRPRSDDLAIGAEGNAIHPTTMTFEGAQMLAACGIPQPDGAIPSIPAMVWPSGLKATLSHHHYAL